jgi:hypothetical protein
MMLYALGIGITVVVIISILQISHNSELPDAVKMAQWQEKQNRRPYAGLIILALIVLPILVFIFG